MFANRFHKMTHTRRGAFHRRLNGIGLLCLILLGLTACQVSRPAAAAAVSAVTFRAQDHRFVGPARIPAGLVSLTFVNEGQETHNLQLVEVPDGVSADQVVAAFAQGDEAVAPLLKSFPGGAGPVQPGASLRVTLQLAPGQYVLLCFVADPQGVMHMAHGMAAPLTVTGHLPDEQAEPVADRTVTLHDFAYTFPDKLRPGEQSWKVVNTGAQVHEMHLMRLAAGKSIDDVFAYLAAPHAAGGDPPPFAAAGGFQAIDPGKSGWLHFNLEPGTYIAICNVPDLANLASGKLHFELGMVQLVTVQ